MGVAKEGGYIMKKYTQKDFDDFKVVDGFKICPTGEYSGLSLTGMRCKFDARCEFKNRCKFGRSTEFGHSCIIGRYCCFDSDCVLDINCIIDVGCKFGDFCNIGADCKIGEQCILGDHCELGINCTFGNNCEFRPYCTFDERCKFGKRCNFGKECIFGYGCNYENGRVFNGEFLRIGNIGAQNQEVYLYMDEDEKAFLRTDLFFFDLEEIEDYFEEQGTSQGIREEYLCVFDIGIELLKLRRKNRLKESD